MRAIDAIAEDAAWAVGVAWPTSNPFDLHALALRWDGVSWTSVPTPPVPGLQQELLDVAMVSETDVWAAGWKYDNDYAPLIEHWDGTNLSVVPAPTLPGGQLWSVAATGTNDVWAAGFYTPSGSNAPRAPFVEHWNGSAWSIVSLPPTPKDDTLLTSIVATSATDVWATGSHYNSTSVFSGGMTLHWDGSSWTVLFTDRVPRIAASDETGLWGSNQPVPADHLCPAQVSDTGFDPSILEPGVVSGVVWQVPTNASGPHRIVDDTGMNLFDSGPIAPGGRYVMSFPAGTYALRDPSTSQTATVASAIYVAPYPGYPSNGRNHVIQWALVPPPAGFVFDVQVKRPTSLVFQNLARGVTSISLNFTPKAPGTYTFRARLRNKAGGQSDWSPTGSFVHEL
jgi:hypothetical protein